MPSKVRIVRSMRQHTSSDAVVAIQTNVSVKKSTKVINESLHVALLHFL